MLGYATPPPGQTRVTLFEPTLHHATRHGIVVGVPIPDARDPVPEAVLARLPPAERDAALALGGYRQVSFVGGRIALRAARRHLGASLDPVLSDARGAPILPAGLAGSVSHKRTLAVAMVSATDGATVGVDLEDYGPARPRILDRILRPEELEDVLPLPPDRQWIAAVTRFSIKESIYKALDPWVKRYVDFHEARVDIDLSGRARVELHLKHGEGPFVVDARFEWWEGRLLSSVTIRPVRA